MTQSEKNTKQSEKYVAKPLQLANKSLQGVSNLLFHLLQGSQQVTFTAPVRGVWNILIFQKSNSCIVEIASQKEELTESQRVFRLADKGESITIISPFHAAKQLIVFFPETELPQDIQQSIAEKSADLFIKTTNKDSRISLALANIQELHQEENYINKLKLQACIAELFIYQMEELWSTINHDNLGIKKSHYEKTQLAKNLIDADYSLNHTIADLAKKVGTNEQYLKKYFKLCYGKTVMNYITQVKMEQAKKLILEDNYRIADISIMTGYKHATHFTTAFKKYFGILPNSLRFTIASFSFTEAYLVEYLPFLPF